jgi:hypothetical protein
MRLRQTWTRQRWCRLCENEHSIAAPRPLPPSEMTSSGAPSPRSLRSSSSARQASVDSAAPGARPRNTGLPSVSMPQATSTGSALALGCSLKNDPSRDR